MKRIFHLAFVLVFVLSTSIPVLAGQVDSVSDFSCADVTEIPQIECEALVALYNSTNGPGWTHSYNWLVTNTPSNWNGVTVSSGHVTEIYLGYDQLNGSIPPELGNLTNLTWLRLDNNQLSGSIPPELGNLTNLTWLALYNNQLTGSIPAELGNLSNLVHLYLSSNQLSSSIPPQLGNLINLDNLYLDSNLLSGSIPPELGDLPIIFAIDLSNNNLGGSIPPELGNLASLQYLWLYGNQLNGSIPIELGNLTNLYLLHLGHNQLTGSIPPELGNLSSLQELNLEYNQLSGGIPPELGLRSYLRKLNLGVNQLSGNLPAEIGNFSFLRYLDIHGNLALTGPLPYSLMNLALDSFIFFNTDLCEPDDPAFQAWLAGIPDLHGTGVLCSYSCAQVTEIPEVECEALKALFTSTYGAGWIDHTNWISTYSPSDWYGVSLESGHVAGLYLGNNQLNGTIPAGMGTLSGLQELNLGHNQLSGIIPPEMGSLTGLTLLDLSDNMLSGSLPPGLGNLGALTTLYLNHNQLSGNIPAELGSLASLESLYLGNNALSGNIPPELGDLAGLQYLDLGWNHLGGTIPVSLGDLANLRLLYLGENQLDGSLPPELGGLPNLLYLFLQGNQSSGSIPSELGDLTSLTQLWLQDNLLEGDIPPSLANLTSLFDPGQAYGGNDGLDLDYNLLTIPPNYPDPLDPLQVFLSQKDPDWHLYQRLEWVIGAGGGQFTSLDGRVDFTIPAGAVITDTTFTFTPLFTPHHSAGRLAFLHNGFELTAADGSGNPVTVFNLPITVTLTYTDADFGLIAEESLGLYYWDDASSAWTDAVSTCPGGEYTRDMEANWFNLPLCHLTEFGLFGNPLHIFLPLLRR